MLKRSLFLILFIFAYSSLFPYKNVKVVLIASKDNQNDTLGYNIVSGLAQWTYDKLKEGKIKMWATPYKSEEMSFTTLQGMEISSSISFLDCQNLFFYEIWTSDKSQTSFTITGISFSSENKNGEMISFGFIDYSSIEEFLNKDYIPITENGSYKTTFNQVLMNKSFDFEIVYFKNSPIQSPKSKDPDGDYKNGVKIKNKAFNPTKLNLNYIPVKPAKMIEYSIRTSDYDLKTNNIISALENYFNSNKKDLYKYGGSELYKYFNDAKIILSECVIKEIWTKEGNEPKVQKQIDRYNSQIKNNETEIIEEYSKYIDALNSLFELYLDKPDKVDKNAVLLIFGFDKDQLQGRLKNLIIDSLSFKTIKHYSIGNLKGLDIKNMWK